MNKKPISLALCLVMLLSVLPLSAFSTEGELDAPTCTCDAECTADAMNAACAVCAAEGAMPENCAKHTHPVDPTAEPTPTVTPEPTPTPEADDTAAALAAVQAMVDDLPTADAATPADYDAFCAVCDALDALSPEQAAAITGMDKLEALGEYFASHVTTLDDPVSDPVAKIGETGYATLDDAFNAAQDGDKITLCKEAAAVGNYNGGKTFTLDLAGEKLKTNLYTGYSIYLNSGTLTVTDSTETPQSTSIQANSGSVLNIEGGCFDTININGGTVNIKGGTVNAATFSSGGALNISAADNGTVPTINNINCTGYNPPTLSFDSSFISNGGVVGKLTADPGMNISCGAYKSIAVDVTPLPGSSSASSLLDILADDYAIYEEDSSGRTICDVKGVASLLGREGITYYVLHHTCDFGADGTCACGRVCEHALGENGKCSGCGADLKVKGVGSGTTKYYTAMPVNLQRNWTYTLLSDMPSGAYSSFSTVEGGYLKEKNATIDINGHKLGSINFSGGGRSDSLKITDSVGGGSLTGGITLDNSANLTLDNIGGSLGSAVTVKKNSKLSFSGNTTPDLSKTSFTLTRGDAASPCGSVDFAGLKGKTVKSISIETRTGLKLGSSNIGLVFESFTYTDNDDVVTQVAGLLLNAYPAIKLVDASGDTIPAATPLNTFSSPQKVKVAACTKHEKNEVETLYKYVCKHCGQAIVAEMTSGGTTSYYIRLSEAVEAAGASPVSIKMLNNSPYDSNGMDGFDNVTVTEGNITLDLNGYTLYGKLTVNGGTIKLKNDSAVGKVGKINSIESNCPLTGLLCDGYGYTNVDKNQWYDYSNVNRVSVVYIAPAPIRSITKSITPDPATTSITYSDSLEVKMEITGVTPADGVTGTPTYEWFTVNANGEVTAIADNATNTLTLNKTNAGTYKYRCKITLGDYIKPVDFDFTVNKATLNTPTAPTANKLNGSDLVFKPIVDENNVYTTTGEPQKLVSAPTGSELPTGCKYEYKVGENGAWKDNIDAVTGTNAGTYKVYWRVNGGDNYQDYTPNDPIEVKIAPAVITNIIVNGLTKTEKTYDGTANLPSGNTPEYHAELKDNANNEYEIILTPDEDFTCKLEYAKDVGTIKTELQPDTNVGKDKYIRATITLKNANFVFGENETELVRPAEQRGEITPTLLKISAVEKQVKIGDAVPKLDSPVLGTDYTVEGLVNNETAAEIGLTDKLFLEYYDAEAKNKVTPDTSKPGTYMIVPSLKQPAAVVAALYALVNPIGDNSPDPLDNYELKFEPGKFIVTENPKYTITSKAGVNGTISPLGVTTVEEGSSQTYVITPNPGYVIASVKVDGVNLGSIAKHTFSNIDRDHTIEATFMLPWGNPQTGVDVD